MIREGGTRHVPRAGDDVDHAVRKADLTGETRQVDRREGCVLGRLDHHRVAGGQRRGDAPADEQEGEVPGKDESARPPWMTHGPGLVARDRQRGAVLHVERHVGEVAKRVDEILHIAHRLVENLPGIERLDLADDRLVLLDRVGQPVEQHPPLVRREPGPRRSGEGMGGRPHGPVDVLRREGVDLGEHPAAAGVERLDRLAGRSGHVLSADHRLERRRGEKRFNFGQEANVAGRRGGHGHGRGSAEDGENRSLNRGQSWEWHGYSRKGSAACRAPAPSSGRRPGRSTPPPPPAGRRRRRRSRRSAAVPSRRPAAPG